MAQEKASVSINTEAFVKEVLHDYYLACVSREASLLGRKEVLTGKAKFGIFGDGKELAQIAMAKQFQNGDFRSGYYRDQTFMLAIGQYTVEQAFAALYAHADVEAEPTSGGRQMGSHFATRSLNPDGTWKDLTSQKNSSADISPTAGQMPRLLGLAQASKVYRQHPGLQNFSNFSKGGNEVAFGTIGDASTSEGLFWETFNAAGVLQVPMVISVWDDGYGISVPKSYQTTKSDISAVLKGFQRENGSNGYELFRVKGWDYPELVAIYEKAVKIAREEHIPVLVHVEEVTQPQGHSTSGSHERYKTKEFLEWCQEYDGLNQFRNWILKRGDIASEEEIEEIEQRARKEVKASQKAAWNAFQNPIIEEQKEALELLENLAGTSSHKEQILTLHRELKANPTPIRKDNHSAVRQALFLVRAEKSNEKQRLTDWLKEQKLSMFDKYSSQLYSSSRQSALNIKAVAATYPENPDLVDGRLILRDNFEVLFERHPEILIFGEDVGKIGGVNQTMEGMQQKFGELRVSDTGIREATIIGQGIGMAMRGLRPIAEIQYLDYVLYALQLMSDDLATVQYRTKGGQKAPLIISTRGHRLEGIWHSGSPMGGIINLVRGIYVCVPRNMKEAAGFYNTLIQSDDPALVIEPLNGYRTKERKPENLGDFTTPLGIPEIVEEGTDLTIVSYGSTFNLCHKAVEQLRDFGISAELIDIRTLLPFDSKHLIKKSLQKTNRLLIVDEDVPGGASAYILDKILNEQKGFYLLDSPPVTLTAQEHRPAYGSDGDYFSKPGIEDIFETAYGIMSDSHPESYPPLF